MAARCLQAGHGHPDTEEVAALDVVEKVIRGGDRLKRLLQRETVLLNECAAWGVSAQLNKILGGENADCAHAV